MTRIAVDAMGGDRAPDEIVHGAVEAAKQGREVVLVGEPSGVGPILDEIGYDLELVPASEVIHMTDDPAAAIREKKDASISVAAGLVADGGAAGLVSAGSTGAAMAASVFVIGRLPGVARPAIATLFPGDKIVLDSGANLTCRPEHLVQWAAMGATLAEITFGVRPARVGLVNIGEEEGKGRDLEKEAYAGLAELAGIEFVGNVEGRDLGSDKVDVLVTDGFTGNVLLKTAEGAAHLVQRVVLETMSHPDYQEPFAELAPALLEVRQRINPETRGGGHLLGVGGVVVIAHGSSSRVAIANAIAMAAEAASQGLVSQVAARFSTED